MSIHPFPTPRDSVLPFRDRRRIVDAQYDANAALRLSRLVATMWSVIVSVELAHAARPMPDGLLLAYATARAAVAAHRAGDVHLTEGEVADAAYKLADAIRAHGGREVRS